MDLALCLMEVLFNDANNEVSWKGKLLDQINSEVAGISKRESIGYFHLFCVSMYI